ncbi:uncharacterized protein LOC124677181 isoform X2 [Lolium rigidum]|uniref:uncharacterized protein LOC124669568 isoform X3 n=1 Tax=Lolium rigidum TaxID=89674 RepID=UPI001F5D5549|nr:uncharacterized protein LOC124669568 isoform X3 [Lolium rigidum]XP_047062123.1 uncharacterized protein LOC124669572 isoform X2 [Lolium rigidum]XP_047069137.1 uncharacterized protein LOC124677181 isoform X2 [Lolium rigidum]
MVGVIARLADLNPLNRVPSIRAHLEAEGGSVLNSGVPIEVHASKIHTPNMFGLFQSHLFQVGSYIVPQVIDGHSWECYADMHYG